ncbi:MAG: hypothetical protein K2H30_05785, partial [Clostridia bacterium]|nr:hypothetical protein [Clostridia bacterium]
VPTLKDGATFTFNGDTQGITSSLDNWDGEYMEFAANSIHEARNAGSYTVIINIKEEFAGNYIFVLPESTAEPMKAIVRYALADEELPELSNNSSTASFKWTIEKYVIDTTASSAWNFAANGASLNLPNWVKALTAGAEPTLNIQVVYYDTDGNPLTEYELKGGNKFLVAAYVDPACADFGNFEFKNQAVDPMTSLTTSPQTAYTVPVSGAAAFIGNVKDFVTKTWLGLPIWAWLAIGLVVLILLIIIIAVACKRRKSKEERQAIKERKEEERRIRQEKLEAERELAKAKQEAELEKIRAQAGMAGVGMASMAMPQQVPQPIPMQQSVQPYPAPVQQQMPLQQPQMMQTPAPQAYDGGAMARIEAELAAIREEQKNKTEAELANARLLVEFERLRGDMKQLGGAVNYSGQTGGVHNTAIPADVVIALLEAVKSGGSVAPLNITNAPAPAAIPQSVEESASQPVMAQYPSDAVITTTTTVDTTKAKPIVRKRDEDGNFDIDGFYD